MPEKPRALIPLITHSLAARIANNLCRALISLGIWLRVGGKERLARRSLGDEFHNSGRSPPAFRSRMKSSQSSRNPTGFSG